MIRYAFLVLFIGISANAAATDPRPGVVECLGKDGNWYPYGAEECDPGYSKRWAEAERERRRIADEADRKAAGQTTEQSHVAQPPAAQPPDVLPPTAQPFTPATSPTPGQEHQPPVTREPPGPIEVILYAVSGIGLIVFIVALYFLPYLAAKRRRHSKREAIFILNLLLGWTFLGWAIALIWAYTENNATA